MPQICDTQKLYVAEYDLMFFRERWQMTRHLRKCKLQVTNMMHVHLVCNKGTCNYRFKPSDAA